MRHAPCELVPRRDAHGDRPRPEDLHSALLKERAEMKSKSKSKPIARFTTPVIDHLFLGSVVVVGTVLVVVFFVG